MNGKVQKKAFDWEEILAALVCVLAAAAMFVRCFFGTELTDEVYAISDSLAAMYGNLPFAYNTSVIPAQSLVPMVFYKVYEWFVPSLEGIVLYSRLAFVAFKLVILWIIYRLLEPDLNRKYRLLMVGTMIPFFGSQMQNFSYNTVAAFLTLLVSVLLYSANKDTGWKLYGKLLISGFLTAIAVFSHVARAVAVFVFLVLIWINSESACRLKNAVLYCAGGIIGILVVMVPIGVAAGFDRLLYGLETFLFYGQSLPDNGINETVQRFYNAILFGRKNWFILIVGTVCGCVLLNYAEKKRGKTVDRQANCLLVMGWILIVQILRIHHFGLPGFILTGAFAVCLVMLRQKNAMDWYIALPCIGHTLFLLLTTSASYWDRFLYMIPVAMVVLHLMFSSDSRALLKTGMVFAVVFIMQTSVWDYRFVYRDEAIVQLKSQVEEGVYKGLYTTESRAKDLPELERYLNENISLEETVSFRDNVPVAYMIRNKNIWDVRTWDEMQWTYGCNNPTGMYRYYKNREGIPDVISYIDFGRDDILSIEATSEEFPFNDFVNQYYVLDSDEQINETFRVLIYRRNELPAPDYDLLIAGVK